MSLSPSEWVPHPSRHVVRVAVLVVVLVGLVPSLLAVQSAGDGGVTTTGPASDTIRDRTVPDRSGITVVTTDAFGGGRITAFGPDGEVIYYADEHSLYHDVDPSPTGEYNVTYVATDYPIDECSPDSPCAASFIEEVNLSTEERTRHWERIRPVSGTFGIHDVDQIGPDRFAVADIANPDSVYAVNTTSGVREWHWSAQADFDLASGGNYPGDWTHLNDVEVLANGTAVISVRNQDQVVFVHPERGLLENMTLGADGDHNTLYEQHNPDYIPRSQGGPALLVADSENGRIVEYQRVDGEWEREWLWRDAQMQWPRDADRLPNGNTLITDTNSDRLIEVNETGAIVWEMSYPGPYEAERLSTGAESAGGESATALELESRGVNLAGAGKSETVDRELDPAAQFVFFVQQLIPRKLVNAILFVLPPWATPLSVIGLAGSVGALLVGVAAELYWSPLRLRSPVQFE
jgi:hypothetical protein